LGRLKKFHNLGHKAAATTSQASNSPTGFSSPSSASAQQRRNARSRRNSNESPSAGQKPSRESGGNRCAEKSKAAEIQEKLENRKGSVLLKMQKSYHLYNGLAYPLLALQYRLSNKLDCFVETGRDPRGFVLLKIKKVFMYITV
jgi:hypothetical protein